MTSPIRLGNVTLECPDARTLANFYATIAGGRITFVTDGWVTVPCPGGRLDFQTSPGHKPPIWPDDTSSMQIHLDFDVEAIDDAEARVLDAGATRYEHQPNAHCRVYADPAGHPFGLSTDDVTETTTN